METGRKRVLRPRVVIYPALLTIVVGLLVTVLVTMKPADVTLLRAIERPFITLDSGEIQNNFQIKVVNRTEEPRTYTFALEDVSGGRVEVQGGRLDVSPRGTGVAAAGIVAPATSFRLGRASARIRVEDGLGFSSSYPMTLQGPFGSAASAPTATTIDPDPTPQPGDDA